ncbi:hypothetical protein EV649_3171 [Kribbella sp. VKM Ac-2569]|uniref:hypothetical protein n=1 Tax=Kribbella sp. VKM Ac-2569 TaxID=2512220 RepID=UPI00102B7E5C|nr:hypothetical protein [Kribbella sp. VKM Ac-2569]RZT20031.1 hypothetical protein EV649_3171 [Kribbella sp. VKM Ac-2569]
MTTPSEGRPGWEQGSWGQSMDWLSNLSEQQQENLRTFVGMTPDQRQAATAFVNLDDRQQANLMRAANSDPLKDRVSNAIRGAVARVHLTYDRTQTRLSEMATSLASQGRQYRDAAVTGVRDARDTVVQGARDARDTVVQGARDARDTVVQGARDTRDTVVQGARGARDRVEELGQQAVGAYETGRDRVVDAAQRGQVRLDQAWQSGADRVGEMRDSVVQGARGARDTVVQGARDGRDAVVGAGRDAMAAGRNAAAKAGRWFEGKFNNAMVKAESSLASYNAGRHDPELGANTISAKDRTEMAQKFSAAMSAPTLEERNQIIQGMAQSSQAQMDAQNSALRALGGVAPAAGAIPQGATQTQQPTEQAATTNLQKNNDNKGIGGR